MSEKLQTCEPKPAAWEVTDVKSPRYSEKSSAARRLGESIAEDSRVAAGAGHVLVALLRVDRLYFVIMLYMASTHKVTLICHRRHRLLQ